jgi:hypothetical protein
MATSLDCGPTPSCQLNNGNRVIRFLLILGIAIPYAVVAQPQATPLQNSSLSSVAGTVRDSLGLPVVGASVLIAPDGLILRTDSAGRFYARRITARSVTIDVRRLGFSPLQARVELQVGAEVALDLAMTRLPQMLDEVIVKAERQCPRFSLEGILCRREQGMGIFMNRQEILSMGKDIEPYPMLVLREVPGFRQNLNGNPRTVESTVGWRCFVRIVDGGFTAASPIHKASDLYAVEVYQPPDIPKEYQHWHWRPGRRNRPATPCTLVVMWSMQQAQRDLRRLAGEKK